MDAARLVCSAGHASGWALSNAAIRLHGITLMTADALGQSNGRAMRLAVVSDDDPQAVGSNRLARNGHPDYIPSCRASVVTVVRLDVHQAVLAKWIRAVHTS
jgi:hypothetical protein